MNYCQYEPSQTEEIIGLFAQTFSDSEGEAEGKLIGELVKELIETTDSNDLYVFVANTNNRVVGSILFTRLTFESDKQVFLLAPVAVCTDYQGQGIGQELIKVGLQAIKNQGAELAFTYGDPAFYSKVGFRQVTEDQFKAPLSLSYPHGWLAQSLTEQELTPIAGGSICVPAFNKQALW
ncbi:GNAT family N-acetyltransferase [Photobacterium alginatilyticum]|uniref:GNAT family N-acetyltransferase n=1 Tax=Photobacterium alginatilyticum TaxID=1775171 RepID=UPI004068966D